MLTNTNPLFTRTLLVMTSVVSIPLLGCDPDDEGAADQGIFAEGEDPVESRCSGFCVNTPSAGPTGWDIANGNAIGSSGASVYGVGQHTIVRADTGYMDCGSVCDWVNLNSISEIAVDYANGNFDVKVNGSWVNPAYYENNPPAYGWKTRLVYDIQPYGKGDDRERTCAEVIITSLTSSTVNSQTLEKYSIEQRTAAWANISGGCTNIDNVTWGSGYNPTNVCGSSGGQLVFLPRVWQAADTNDGNRPFLSDPSNTGAWVMACADVGAVGKFRNRTGMLPLSSSSAHYQVARYNAGILAIMAWHNGAARTDVGISIKIKDLYNGSSPKFNESPNTSGTYNGVYGWDGDVREIVYTDTGSSYRWFNSDFPYAGCGDFTNGKHRKSSYSPPGVNLSGWSSLSTWGSTDPSVAWLSTFLTYM